MQRYSPRWHACLRKRSTGASAWNFFSKKFLSPRPCTLTLPRAELLSAILFQDTFTFILERFDFFSLRFGLNLFRTTISLENLFALFKLINSLAIEFLFYRDPRLHSRTSIFRNLATLFYVRFLFAAWKMHHLQVQSKFSFDGGVNRPWESSLRGIF